jgi:hypothetical protein
MKKLALAIDCGAIIAFSTSEASLAAVRSDNSGAYARVIVWSGGPNVGLVFVNERLYPDTITSDTDNTIASMGIASPDNHKRAHLNSAAGR